MVIGVRPVIGAALLVLAPVSAGAGTLDGKWEPISNTGAAITGDITLSATAIRFQYGRAPLPVAAVAVVGAGTAGTLYRVTAPAPLRLRNGNTLCASPATWFLVTPKGAGEVTFSFFETAGPPGPGDESCLISAYARK